MRIVFAPMRVFEDPFEFLEDDGMRLKWGALVLLACDHRVDAREQEGLVVSNATA